MKYLHLLTILCFYCFSVNAQNESFVIEATTDKNVFLFFPSPISQALVGNHDFHFGYNTETAQNFGVLKASANADESTLHIITQNQTVYSFIVKYNPQVSVFEHFFDGSEKVGQIGAREQTTEVQTNKGLNALGRKITDADYKEEITSSSSTDIDFAQELVERKDYFKTLFRRKNDIVLKVTNIAYREDKTFICLEVINDSPLDYDVNFVQFNKVAKKSSHKANYQAIEIKPLLKSSHAPFVRIEAMSSSKAVYVFEKLAIDNNKLIHIEMNELNGERNLVLPVTHRNINNPNL